ncbi:PGF-pre-PGF domain-containing protein [Methanomethylovorans sp.]|uniref:PGF-pre-PGF domain-containing protein n=1 Tax=Methanomethylovorans sp. TaxID=2758717 RepID=UPI00351C7186
MNILLFCAAAGITAETDNTVEKLHVSTITESNTTESKSSFIHVQYHPSENKLKRSSLEKSNLVLKTATIQTNAPSGSVTNSVNIDISCVEGYTESPEEYNYYIVQFNDTVQEMWKQDISEAGGQLFDYVPQNAFIVGMNKSTISIVSNLEQVRWIGEYLQEYKISPPLLTKTEENISVELMVSLFEPTNNESVKEKVTEEILSLGGTILEGSNNDRIHISIVSAKIAALSSIPDVKWIEEYETLVVFNDVARGITNATYVSENYNLTGHGQIIAIADTGLDTGINNGSMNPDFYGRILSILDVAGDGSEDLQGHGTHVTGSVLGNGSWSGGQYKGVAPEAQLVFQAIADADGNLIVPGNNVSSLFEPAYELGARIHSNSWGGSGDGQYNLYSRDVDQFMWTHPDMLILFAAGNSGVDSDANGVIDLDSISWPSTAKNCLTVGASENNRGLNFGINWGYSWSEDYPVAPIYNDKMANNPEGIAAFSSRGPTDDGRIKPDIVAPGTYIISVNSSVSDNEDVWDVVDKHYVYMGGTSMATPLVAGSVALIRQNYVDNLNITPSAALLKATLINGASNLQPGQYGNDVTAQPDYNQGWGLVNLRKSLYPASGSINFADDIELQTGDAVEKNYYVNSSSNPFKTTLVWTDYYGSEIAGGGLVNDLTLLVVQPDGTENVVNDTVNNVEQVLFEEPEIGWYTVKVIGESTPMGPQPCSVVVSGASGTISSLNFTPQQTTYYTGNSTTFEAEAIDENENSLNASFTWESSNATVASINSSTGYFSALVGGVTNITVNAGTMSSTVSINVFNAGNATQTNETSEEITNEEEENEEETTSTRSSGSSGGSGGGGGTSGESIANVVVKDPKTVFISKDTDIKYEFTEDGNSIGYIEFTSLKNSGKITAVVEVLKSRSSFASSNAPGMVYQNMNVWVGKTGFATENNIADPRIGFKVEKLWMASNIVDKVSIRLYRYNANVWNELPTTITDEDDEYVYFESQAPGFSPFAISTESTTTEIRTEISAMENNTPDNVKIPSGQIITTTTNYTEINSIEDKDGSSADKFGYLSKFTIASIILVICGIVYLHYIRRK